MPIIDEFPFPLHNPMALELIRVLAGMFRTEREAVPFTSPFGIDSSTIPPDLAPIELWYHLLPMLAMQGTVRAVVLAARDKFPKNPHVAFLNALLANATAPVSAEPIPNEGAGFNDSVTEPEALLFFDDLTIPVGQVSNLMSTLNKVTAMAPAICLLRVAESVG